MKIKSPKKVGIAILVAVVIIVTSIVMHSYNKNKTIIPDVTHSKVLENSELAQIKAQYDREGISEEFVQVYKKIELAVANKLLDGTVTSEEQLKLEVKKIDKMFKTDDWSYLGIDMPRYWMGIWGLDNTGKLYFSFEYEEIVPVWVNDIEVKEYIK